MEFIRNTFGVLLGLAVAGLIISLGVRINTDCVSTPSLIPFNHWEQVLAGAENRPLFFWILLASSGVGVTVGGVVTAIVVRYAKVAYAILIGFIMLFVAMVDIVIFPYHPTFYKILIFVIYFPFSWVGGKIIEMLYERKKRKHTPQ